MPRYKLTIEYDGSPFAGWQIQADRPTVQGVLTAAIEALSGEKILVQGAGRTDAGVHARGQVAHVDLAKDWDTDTVRDALNAHLRPIRWRSWPPSVRRRISMLGPRPSSAITFIGSLTVAPI